MGFSYIVISGENGSTTDLLLCDCLPALRISRTAFNQVSLLEAVSVQVDSSFVSVGVDHR